MAHFYASIAGRRGPASRLGTRSSGIEATAASWQGAVSVRLYERDGVDMADVELMPWHGNGAHRTLYRGPVAGTPESCGCDAPASRVGRSRSTPTAQSGKPCMCKIFMTATSGK
jgi:hypothetical protein